MALALASAQTLPDSSLRAKERDVQARLAAYTDRQAEWSEAQAALSNSLATLDPCSPTARKLIEDAVSAADSTVRAMDTYLAGWAELTAQRTAAQQNSPSDATALAPDAEKERAALEQALATLAKLNPPFDTILGDQLRRAARNDVTGADQSLKTTKIVEDGAAGQKAILAADDALLRDGLRGSQSQLAKWRAFYQGKASEIAVACVNKK